MTIAVAVSGGMDSLLSLVLLKEQGFDIMAVHGHFLPPNADWKRVAEGLDVVCKTLGVPFHALDLHKAFDAQVIAPFRDDYRVGLTPNPCAICNLRMKFGVLFDAARKLGADEIATGHYVRLEDHPKYGRVLVRGIDRSKDQSYFLSLVPIESLRRAHFPLADTYKKDVLALLATHGLTPPIPTESQEICFVPNDDYQSFLAARGSMPGRGAIVLSDGRKVGTHNGLWRHTQGQRRGLGVAWTEPLYVIDKDVAKNQLIVGTKQELETGGCVVRHVNTMVDPALWPEVVLLQTRYRQQARPCKIDMTGEGFSFRFLQAQGRPTPGQIAAMYTEDGIVLGGGVIEGMLQ